MPQQRTLTYQLDRWKVGPGADPTTTQVVLTLVPPGEPAVPTGMGGFPGEFAARPLEVGGLDETIVPHLTRGMVIHVGLTFETLSAAP